jgi:hypothetical protein
VGGTIKGIITMILNVENDVESIENVEIREGDSSKK